MSEHVTESKPFSASNGARGKRIWLACGFLLLVTIAVYWPVTDHGFVDYDDADYVFSNSHVQAGLTWDGLRWALTTGRASNWHPLTWLSHMLDVSFFGNKPQGAHVTNLFFHCLNTLLVFALWRCLTGNTWRSLFVAAIFALHPLHVESVAWISERKDVLSAFFGLLTLWAYARYANGTRERFSLSSQKEERAGERKPTKATQGKNSLDFVKQSETPVKAQTPHPGPLPVGRGEGEAHVARRVLTWYFVSLTLFALGLMSKPMLVTLPFVLLLLDWWPLQRFTFHVSRFTLRQILLEKLPFILLSLLSCVVTFLVQKKGGAVSVALPLSARAANAVVACARYLRKTVWPDDLSVLYPHPGHWPIGAIIAATLLVIVITGVAIWLAKKLPYIAVGWFWFLGMLVPVIGLVQVGIQSMADRYMYLPLIGLSVAVVWGAGALLERSRKLLPPLSLVGAVVLVGCVMATHSQVGIWKNTETLFRRAVSVTTSNYLAYNNLGFYLAKNGRVPEAMEHYRESLKINPNYEDANNNLGHALADQRKYAEAIQLYRVALRTAPNNLEVRNNLANALSETGNLDEAIVHYRFVLDKNPKHVNALNGIGSVLAMKGQLDEAMVYFTKVLEVSPNDSSVHGNLGNAYAVKRDFQKAMEQYKEALRLSPADHQTMNNLGNVLSELGRLDEAVTNYQAALKIRADNPEAHFNLGYALLRLSRRDEARGHFESALKYKPDYVEARRQLDALNAAK